VNTFSVSSDSGFDSIEISFEGGDSAFQIQGVEAETAPSDELVESLQQEIDSAQAEVDAAQEVVDSAQDEVDAAQEVVDNDTALADVTEDSDALEGVANDSLSDAEQGQDVFTELNIDDGNVGEDWTQAVDAQEQDFFGEGDTDWTNSVADNDQEEDVADLEAIMNGDAEGSEFPGMDMELVGEESENIF
jgi:hypothetical protein